MVNLINIGLGNIKSVENWVNQCGHECKLIDKPMHMDNSTILIPGMCNSYSLMKGLLKNNFIHDIKSRAKDGQRIIGICAGMQVLGDIINEDEGCEGIGILPFESIGFAKKSNFTLINNGWINVKLPQMNDLFSSKINVESRYYFNHQFYIPAKYNTVFDHNSTSKIFSEKIVSFFREKNVIGMQFHPEKSQEAGFLLGNELL